MRFLNSLLETIELSALLMNEHVLYTCFGNVCTKELCSQYELVMSKILGSNLVLLILCMFIWKFHNLLRIYVLPCWWKTKIYLQIKISQKFDPVGWKKLSGGSACSISPNSVVMASEIGGLSIYTVHQFLELDTEGGFCRLNFLRVLYWIVHLDVLVLIIWFVFFPHVRLDCWWWEAAVWTS